MKKKFLFVLVFLAAAGFSLGVFSDVVFRLSGGYSTQPAGSVGAWEDVMWQAGGIMYTDSQGKYRVFTASNSSLPNISSLPIGSKRIPAKLEKIGEGENYVVIPGVSVPAEFAVIEWRVCGQLRFRQHGL